MDLQAWVNFRDNLNVLHDMGRKAPIFDELRAVIRYVAEIDGVVLKGAYDAALYAEAEIKRLSAHRIVPPRPAGRPAQETRLLNQSLSPLPASLAQFTAPKTRHAMIMKEIYDSACPFDDRENPEELREFLSPGNGLRDLPWPEWSAPQKNKLTVTKISYERWCRSQGTTARYLSIEEDIEM